MAAVLLLSTFWEVAAVRAPKLAKVTRNLRKADAAAELGVRILNTLSFLQLCRMRLTLYSMLLQSVLAVVASETAVRWVPAVPQGPHLVRSFRSPLLYRQIPLLTLQVFIISLL